MEFYDGRDWRIDTCTSILDKVFAKIRSHFDKYEIDPNLAMSNTFEDAIMRFKIRVAAPLQWGDMDSLGDGVYVSSQDLRKYKKKIYSLAKELIYINSKQLINASKQSAVPLCLPTSST